MLNNPIMNEEIPEPVNSESNNDFLKTNLSKSTASPNPNGATIAPIDTGVKANPVPASVYPTENAALLIGPPQSAAIIPAMIK